MSIRELVSVMHKTTGCCPPKLVGTSTTVVGDSVYLLGGRGSPEHVFHMYIFNLSTQVWSKLPQPAGPTPSPRYLHSTDLWNGYLIVFGGIVINDPTESPYALDDIWFFSLLESRWISSPDTPTSSRPLPRYGHLSSISADILYIIGGQDKSDNWVDTMHLYDLNSRNWVHRSRISYDCGTYRGLAASSNLRVIHPSEEGYEPPIRFNPNPSPVVPSTPLDSFVELTYSTPVTKENPSEIHMYLNYDFTNLRRELKLFKPMNDPQTPFTLRDLTSDMHANFGSSPSAPSALRFPTGGIIGTYLVLSGIDITTRHSISAWALNLQTLTWTKIEMSSSLLKGSWARSVIWPSCNKLVIFGSRDGDFKKDYQNRLSSWNDVFYVDLEAFGVYQPPLQSMSNLARVTGLAALEDGAFADFEVVCDDGRAVACSRELLEHRWNWFHEERKKWNVTTSTMVRADARVVPSPTSSQKFSAPRSDPRLTPRKLHISEPYPVVVAFLQYLYTQSLMTPLQHTPPVLSSLMLLAATYDISPLADLVAHAMHGALSRSRSFASGIFDVVSLVERSGLRLRAFSIGRRPHALVTSTLDNVAGSRRPCTHCCQPHDGKASHQHHHNKDTHTPSITLPSADSKSSKESHHGTETQFPVDHRARRHSTMPPSVPVSATESPTDSAPALLVTDETKVHENTRVPSRQQNVSVFVATSNAGNSSPNHSVSPSKCPHDQIDTKGTSDESGNVMRQSDYPIEGQLPPIICAPVDPDSDTSSREIASHGHSQTEPDSPPSELRLLELRQVVGETLGDVATGPFWRSRRVMCPSGVPLKSAMGLYDPIIRSARRSCVNPQEISPLIEKKDLKLNSGHSEMEKASTITWVSVSSHEPASLKPYRSRPLESGMGLNTPLGSLIEQQEVEDKGKGKRNETKREDEDAAGSYSPSSLCKRRQQGCPTPISASQAVATPSRLVGTNQGSTTVPQPHYETSHYLLRHPAFPSSTDANLPATSNTSKHPSPIIQTSSRSPQLRSNMQISPLTSSSSRTGSGMQNRNGTQYHSSLTPVTPSESSLVATPARRPLPPFPPTPPLSDSGPSLSDSPSSFLGQKRQLTSMDNEGMTKGSSPSPSPSANAAQMSMTSSPRLPTPAESSASVSNASPTYLRLLL